MVNNLTEAQINEIVSRVISEVKKPSAPSAAVKEWDSTQYRGRRLIGVYETMEEAIEVANEGYKAVRSMTVAQIGRAHV